MRSAWRANDHPYTRVGAMIGNTSPEALTFVFADLESSTRLWESFPDAMKTAMERHDAILREAVEGAHGRVVKITGDGLMAVFRSASDSVGACLRAQQGLHDESWPETGPLRVRMGVHVGEAQLRDGDFYGPSVNRAARIMAAGHGGQVLLSSRAADLVKGGLPLEARLRDLGEHRLKDLSQPEHVYQLVHPTLASDFPPLATLTHRPNNLPTQTSEFVGREAQLATVRDLLDAPGIRLVTLTGPGGIGKTRLALQGVAEQIDRVRDGVFFVDLSAARDADDTFEAIARAVDVTRTSDEDPLEVLKRELPARHMLLLLDNFEHVIDAAEGIVDLLQVCPQLEILVTSREALRVRGEHLFPVPTLSVPDHGVVRTSADAVGAYESVRLFMERAREARPSFALSDENAAEVAEICARLDGLPLAIELAAARLKLFSLDDLHARLRTRLELLRGGHRDLPARQQTLRSTIEWSYDLLDEDERAVFALLSLFSPARVESVEEVVDRLALRSIDVVDVLSSLVDKSLVRITEFPERTRLWMLETVREYAAEKLQQSRELAQAASRAHAEYFSDFAEARRTPLHGSARVDALDELAFELGNLLTAWKYWVAARDLEQLDRLLDGLWVLYDARGWYHAAVELATDLLGVLSTAPSTPERTREEITLRTSLARGLLAIRGYTAEVEQAYEQALALSEEVGELPRRFPVLRSLASFYLYRGEFDKTAAVGRELLGLAEEHGEADLLVEGHLVLGSSLAFLGELSSGLDHLERAIALYDPLAHPRSRFRLGPSPGVVSHTTSALVLWTLGYPDRAVERAARAVELATQLGHPFTLAYAYFHVGVLDLWRRDLGLVETRAVAVLEVAEEHDYRIWRALALALQGVAMTGLGRPDEGLARTEQGVALYEGLTTPPVFWPLLLSIRASGLGLAGQPALGLDLIEPAIQMTKAGDILYPEFALLKGDLLLASADVDGAESSFRSALVAARELGARMPELRAATRLTRLSAASGSPETVVEQLRSVYEDFTEGFETPDLLEALSILHELDARVV
jgi:predicted ATPase/class 3 adenylate cyclase